MLHLLLLVSLWLLPGAVLPASPATYPESVPNVFGGAAHGHPSGFFSGVTGQLFAYSGLDGSTNSTSNFVAIFANQSNYDMRVGAKPQDAYVSVRAAAPRTNVLVATNDVVVAQHGNDSTSTVQMAWSAWNLCVGAVPKSTDVSMEKPAHSIPSPAGSSAQCVASENLNVVLCQSTVDFPYAHRGFGLTYSSGDIPAATLRAANAADRAASDPATYVGAIIQDRLKWIEQTPKLTKGNVSEQRLLNKAVSVMRVNSLSPEGDIDQHWSTPDRLPHKVMWLWDSCYHSMARSVLNDTLGFEFVQSMLQVQDPDGFVPIERSPIGHTDDEMQTQPPLLTWAIMENNRLGRLAGTSDAVLRQRLEWAAPRLEKYLEWDMAHRGDPTAATPLLWWVKGTESGMDNSQRFDNYDRKKPLLAVDFSVFLAREAKLLSTMFEKLNNTEKRVRWDKVSKNISSAVHEALWDDGKGFYFDRHTAKDGGLFSSVAAVSGLLPLWLPDLPKERIPILLATLRDPNMFNTAAPLPSVAANTSTFSTDMWRGPFWLNTNYHVVLALLEIGEKDVAKTLIERTLKIVNMWYETYGVLFEYYDSTNKVDPTVLARKKHQRCGGVRDYHWTAALTLRMLLALEQCRE